MRPKRQRKRRRRKRYEKKKRWRVQRTEEPAANPTPATHRAEAVPRRHYRSLAVCRQNGREMSQQTVHRFRRE
jgi:hypothetical protein